MTLLARVAAVLESLQVPYSLIGAAALAIYGIPRSTSDHDLFVTDAACLDRRIWDGLASEGVHVEVHRGDFQDPLAGVVRFRVPGEIPVDVVVGKFIWQKTMLERTRQAVFDGMELPVIGPADLILLKLYAGGLQDAWDIQQLLEGSNREALIAEVEGRLPDLSKEAHVLWRRILGTDA